MVGSSSSSTSYLLSSTDASAARAAWPPESEPERSVHVDVETELPGQLRESIVEVRGTERQPALEHLGVLLGDPGAASTSASDAACRARSAAATPVRRRA